MNNNDVLRRVRYIFSFNDKKMMEIFTLAEMQVTREQVCNWLKKDVEEDFQKISDFQLATFLNGMINLKRGKKEGAQTKAENRINNNLIILKLKIALNLQAEAVLEVMSLAGFIISKHELSAFFRKADNKHYRECKSQILRNFLTGLQLKYRVEKVDKTKTAES